MFLVKKTIKAGGSTARAQNVEWSGYPFRLLNIRDARAAFFCVGAGHKTKIGHGQGGATVQLGASLKNTIRDRGVR